MHGLILAGGRGLRMGGADKPLLRLGAGCLLDHVIEQVAPQVTGLAISANGEAVRFGKFGLPVLADRVVGQGPLAGILAGLRWAAGEGAERLLVTPGDTPFLPADLGARLAAAAATIAVAASGGRPHPAVALVATRLADDLEAALAEGVRAIRAWMAAHQPVAVVWAGEDPFVNVNTQADLQAAEARLRRL